MSARSSRLRLSLFLKRRMLLATQPQYSVNECGDLAHQKRIRNFVEGGVFQTEGVSDSDLPPTDRELLLEIARRRLPRIF